MIELVPVRKEVTVDPHFQEILVKATAFSNAIVNDDIGLIDTAVLHFFSKPLPLQ
jgi:hypothetical protein